MFGFEIVSIHRPFVGVGTIGYLVHRPAPYPKGRKLVTVNRDRDTYITPEKR